MLHKNQPVKPVTMQPVTLHVELHTKVVPPVTLFPETAPISYYAPIDVMVKPSQIALSTNHKDVALAPEFCGE